MGREDRKPKFQYQPRTAEQTKKRATQSGGMYDSYTDPRFNTFNPKTGINRVRILPPTWANAEHYGIDVWIHSNVGAEAQSYLCPAKQEQKSCLICEEIAKAVKAGDDKYADELKPYRRVLVWMIDRDNEKDGPKLWPMSWSMDRDFTSLSIDKSTNEVLYVDHPDEGYDISFDRTGKGLQTKYVGIQIARRSTPLCDDERTQNGWLEIVAENPLPTVLNYYSDDHISKTLLGKATEKPKEGATRSEQRSSSRQPLPESDDPIPPKRTPTTREPITDPKAGLDDEVPQAKLEPLKARSTVKEEIQQQTTQPAARPKPSTDDDEPIVRPAATTQRRIVDDDNDD